MTEQDVTRALRRLDRAIDRMERRIDLPWEWRIETVRRVVAELRNLLEEGAPWDGPRS